MDDYDFDPAAFGLPTSFGGSSSGGGGGSKKAISSSTNSNSSSNPAKASLDKTRRKEAAATKAEEARSSTQGESSDTLQDHQASEEPPTAGPSRPRTTAWTDPRELDDDEYEQGDQDDQDEEDDEDDTTSQTDYFPVSHEIILKDHTKAVTALSVDPPGARVVTGGYDYDVKLWDFGGMQADYRPFKSFEPYENYHVHDVQWDATGSTFVVVAGTLQAKLYDRDGNLLSETAKGDMYIRDLKNTSGHTGQLTSASWDPRDSTKFLTSSYDSTIRIWDVKEKYKSFKTIVVKSKDRGARTKLTKALYSHDGRTIAASGIDGTIHLWSANSNFARPNATAENAHTKGTETSGLTFSLDNHTLVSRGGDDTVKLWDTRSFKRPVSVQENLTSLNPETNIIFSPDERFILTGTAGPKAGIVPGKEVDVRGKPGGRIVVMKKDNLEIVRELNVSEGSVIRLAWPSRINQILATTSLGEVKVLYSPTLSEKGALLPAARAPRVRRAIDDYDPVDQPIITPHALPMFRDDNYQIGGQGQGKRKRTNGLTKQALKARKPEAPMRGPGMGGRIGEAADRSIVMGMIKDDIRSEDPREALLKYASKEGDKKWTAAWGKDQKTIYDTNYDPNEVEKKYKDA